MLSVVPTPIGNRQDITLRAVEALRAAELARAAGRAETSIYFESPHRIVRTLEALAACCPRRHVCVARELTKAFEEFQRGTPGEVLAHFQSHPPKGEITILVAALDKHAPADDE